jgi:hypothetical protein
VYTYTRGWFVRVRDGQDGTMSEREDDDEGGWGAVPGRESHESDETLTEEERGEEPQPPEYVPPVEPPPSR